MIRLLFALSVVVMCAVGCSREPVAVQSTATTSSASANATAGEKESSPTETNSEGDKTPLEDSDGSKADASASNPTTSNPSKTGGLLSLESDAVNDDTDRKPPSGRPIAVLENAVYNFGTMEPYQRRKHTFIVRNEGDAPLALREGHSSCKCTIGEVANNDVPPGGQTDVVLSWRSAEGNKVFGHEAEILTNDPDNPILRCRVEGRILSRLIADPSEFSMPGLRPGVAEESTVTLSSQVWKSFQISNVKCTMKEATWELTRLTAEEKQPLKVEDGYRLTLKLPDDLPRGFFKHTIQMQITPEGEGDRSYELPINGNVLRRVSIYGKGIDSSGIIKLGKVRRGKGIKKYFNVKVRDPDPILKVKKIQTKPDFLQVSFIENEKVPDAGLYRMLVEIPTDAPRAMFMGDLGKLHVEFENPRFENIDLDVEFAILGGSDF